VVEKALKPACFSLELLSIKQTQYTHKVNIFATKHTHMIHYTATSFPLLKTQHSYSWHIFTTMLSNFALSKVCSVQRLPQLWLHPSLSRHYYR